jgi:lipopolysaccharide transport system permease protein
MKLAMLRSYSIILRGLVLREVASRYQGTFGGRWWYLLNNLAMLALYTTVFGLGLGVRWPGSAGGIGDVALQIFTGLIIFNLAAEPLTRAPGVIRAHPNFVTKVIFPLELLPLVSVGIALYNAGMAFIVLLLAMPVLGQEWHWTVLLAPLLPLVMLPWLLGTCWILAALGVYLRDIGQVIPLLTTAILFCSPIFFPRESLPEAMRAWLDLNPLSVLVDAARHLVLAGVLPPAGPLLLQTVLGLFLAVAGFYWFRLSRQGFADVL